MTETILRHFRENDPVLYACAMKLSGLPEIKKGKPETYFHRLCDSIVSQQLSEKAGAAIFRRFHALFEGDAIAPEAVLTKTHDQLRTSGISNAKARYVRNLASDIVNGTVHIENLDKFSDEDVITELTKVKGIGRWTAEMFLIFTLGREDVFSFGDLGLRNGLKKVYAFGKEPSKRTVERIIRTWSPYKSYGSRILWAMLP